MSLPCPTCGYQAALNNVAPDGTLACPKCDAEFPETQITDRTVLSPNDREARNVFRAARYLTVLLALITFASTIVGYGPVMGVNMLGWFILATAFATVFYIAEQLIFIKAYLRAKAD